MYTQTGNILAIRQRHPFQIFSWQIGLFYSLKIKETVQFCRSHKRRHKTLAARNLTIQPAYYFIDIPAYPWELFVKHEHETIEAWLLDYTKRKCTVYHHVSDEWHQNLPEMPVIGVILPCRTVVEKVRDSAVALWNSSLHSSLVLYKLISENKKKI